MENFVLYILKINLLSAICIFLIIAVSRLVKKRYSSQWKYIMWLLIAGFLIFPIGLLENKKIIEIEVPHKEFVRNLDYHMETGENQFPVADNRNNKSVPVIKNELMENNPKALFTTPAILRIVCIIGIVGFGILTIFKIAVYVFSLRELRRWGIAERNLAVLEIYYRICVEKDIKSPPKLMINSKLQTPILAGLKDTFLYLPNVAYSEKELRLIFVHELYHYRYKDLWYKMLMLTVNTIFWFNPALYILVREAEKDIEYICDSRVIANCSREDCILYNKLLLKTAAAPSYMHYLSAGLNDSATAFKERILYMMRAKTLKKGIIPIMFITLILVTSNVLVGCTLNPASPKSKQADTIKEADTIEETTSMAKPSEKEIIKSESNEPGNTNNISTPIQKPNEKNKEEIPESTKNTEPKQNAETQKNQTDTKDTSPEVPEIDTNDTSSEIPEVDINDTSTETPGVQAKVQLYEINYFDELILGFHEDNIVDGQYIADDYYELVITNVTNTAFDFTVFKVNGETGAGELVFLTNTAVFTGDGMSAAFYGNDYTLSFSFPDQRASAPVVTSINVSGFSPIEGITFTNNSIPGHEFS